MHGRTSIGLWLCLAVVALGTALIATLTPGTAATPAPVAQSRPSAVSGSGGIDSVRPDCARVQADIAALRRSGRPYAACTESVRPSRDPGTQAFSGAGAGAGAGADVGPVPEPPFCLADTWGADRLSSCLRWQQDIRVVDLRTGRPAGTFTVLIEHLAVTDPSALTWTLRTRIDLVRRSGPGTDVIISEGLYECAGECEADSDYGPQVLSEDSPVTGVGTFESTTLGSRQDRPEGRGRAKVTWDFQSPEWVPEEPQPPVETPIVRCDNALPGNARPGCVFPEYVPRIDYSDGAFPDFLNHLRLARASGLSGFTEAAPLNRVTNIPDDVRDNGDEACPRTGSLPRPAGKQCDEYPFRSTRQGAAVGGGLPRTHDRCEITLPEVPGAQPPQRRTGPVGYSICMIDGPQNEAAGTRLGLFYRYQRVLRDEAFFVVIDTPGT